MRSWRRWRNCRRSGGGLRTVRWSLLSLCVIDFRRTCRAKGECCASRQGESHGQERGFGSAYRARPMMLVSSAVMHGRSFDLRWRTHFEQKSDPRTIQLPLVIAHNAGKTLESSENQPHEDLAMPLQRSRKNPATMRRSSGLRLIEKQQTRKSTGKCRTESVLQKMGLFNVWNRRSLNAFHLTQRKQHAFERWSFGCSIPCGPKHHRTTRDPFLHPGRGVHLTPPAHAESERYVRRGRQSW